jgi:hypothetical protein
VLRRLCLEQLETRLAPATFYVAPGGSDSAGGSADHPCQTLQKAANVVNPGDTVIVRAGNYIGFDLRNGQPASRVRRRPGSVHHRAQLQNARRINLEGADYVTIEGFTVNNMPRAGIRSVLNHDLLIEGNEILYSIRTSIHLSKLPMMLFCNGPVFLPPPGAATLVEVRRRGNYHESCRIKRSDKVLRLTC